MDRKVIEQAADFTDNLCHRRPGREGEFNKHDVEPMRKWALGNEREILLAQALPVAAMDEDPGWRIGVRAAEQVEALSRVQAVTDIPLTHGGLIQLRAARLKTRIDGGDIA